MSDPLFPDAEVQKQPAPVVRMHALIPLHAEMTLKKWDDYRAAERARLDARGLRETVEFTDEAGMSYQLTLPGNDYFKSCISDFPTPERLRKLDEDEAEAATLRASAAAKTKRAEKSMLRRALGTVKKVFKRSR